MIPGKELDLGGKKYIVPPLNFSAIKQIKGEIATIFETGLPDMEVVCKAAHLALLRNYPTLTLEDVESVVDYGNFLEVLDAVMNTSGLIEQTGKLQARLAAAMQQPSPTL